MASSMTPAADGNQQSNVELNATLDSEGTPSNSAIRMNRKRTKTGCLTCRKRRIKCDESKPSCRNCIKSKRHCEGYNQRVMFKPPAFDYQPTSNGSAHITFQAGPVPGPAMVYPNQMSGFEADPNMFTQFPPRALEQFVPGHLQFDTVPLQYQPQPLHFPIGSEQHFVQNLLDGTAVSTASFSHGLHMHDNVAQPNMMPSATQLQNLPETQTHIDQSVPRASQNFHRAVPGAAHVPALWNNEMLLHHEGSSRVYANPVTAPVTGAASPAVSHLITGGKKPVSVGLEALPSGSEYVPRSQSAQPINHEAHPSTMAESQSVVYSTLDDYDHELHRNAHLTPNFVLTQGAIQTCDDDYYDVDSDDEREQENYAIVPRHTDHHQVLGQILELNQICVQDQHARRYDTFIHHGMLDNYKLEWVANPLKNAATARIFAHFIAVTGPSLSIFERQPRNTSVLFTEGHIPFSQQGLWTYTMPMAALHNQGLLHAMLAIASLHIARLTGASVTPSLQHYVWATKRVHPDVGHPKKRLQAATIGASMLLGFYEIMTADHIRWNTHLAGSSKLFIETDFAEMTRQVKQMKQSEQVKAPAMTLSSLDAKEQIKNEILGQVFDVDERMVSEFVGKEVRYEYHGRVMDGHTNKEKSLDLVEFGTVKDLYWWYCKQDVYQAILSGDGLLMGIDRWANCPPRAPLGKHDAVYGSFDHLMILLARVADFSARDRARKLKQMEANGGHWIPAQAMNITRPNQQAPPSGPFATEGSQGHISSAQRPTVAPPPTTDPTFYGMAPPPRANVRPPAPYGHFDSPPNSHTSNLDDPIHLQEATRNALAEYGRIRAALHTFSVSLGDYYKPLAQEYQVSLETPFGPALFYRSYDISCLWAVWHMAVIIAIRSHPHMPPAAHMAAAVAKKETAYSANEIGRIVAGIVPSPVDQPLNPSLGAALCESCMPSFFAAVQYDDAEQRHFTVTRIYSIAQRTGWGSVELIANGCETAWVKGAARGGPPYVRVARPQASDDPRLNGSWEQLDPRQIPNGSDQSDRRLVHRRADARVNWAIGVMGTEEDVTMTG